MQHETNQPALANAELAIMELLWEGQSLTAREIRERLYPDATRAQHGTVQRLLQRLEEKGYVQRDAGQPVLVFSASISRSSYAGGQVEWLAKKLTGGSITPLITHFIEQKKISRNELQRLRAILDDHAAEGPGGGPGPRPNDGGQSDQRPRSDRERPTE